MDKLLPENNPDLFHRIALGDEDAFKEAFYHYNQRIYPYLLKKVHSESIARDMVQDVFFKLWLHRGALEDIDHGEAYLFKIAANVLQDYFRKSIREQRLKSDIRNNSSTQQSSVENEVWVSETRKLIERAMQLLPPQRKLVYELRQQGLSYDEIATQLNLSTNTVKNQLIKASKTIREFLISSGLAVMLFILLEEV